jgi:RNA polymerase sigma factor (sigma-70 family)
VAGYVSDEELALAAQHGDKAAMNELWERLKGFAWWIINKTYINLITESPCVDEEDAIQAAYIGYLKTLHKFHYGKTKLHTAFKFRVKDELRDLLGFKDTTVYDKDSKKAKDITVFFHPALSLDEQVGESSNSAEYIEALEAPPDKYFEDEDEDGEYIRRLRATLKPMIAELTEKQRRVIYCIYYREFNVTESGRVLNMAREGVRDLRDRALVRLRSHKDELKPFWNVS